VGSKAKIMKLGIIGVGAVGLATAMAAASRARVREIVLVNHAPRQGGGDDAHCGMALSPLVDPRRRLPTCDAGLASSLPASMKRPAAPPTAATRPAACACSTPT
jgi:glycine/D-amino acid oxidase-like deaminating enzyme